jgi:hypothetical protein
MPGIVIALYTAVGGAIGAGLTQYLTHVRDRRSARAGVIERLAETDELFIELTWPSTNESLYTLPRMPKLLGKLEATALIAGIPRTVIILYSASCRFQEDSRRLARTADMLEFRLADLIATNADALSARSNSTNIMNRLELASSKIVLITSQVKNLYSLVNTLHDNSLELIGTALWRPYSFRFSMRRLRNLQKSADILEDNIKNLSDSLRQLEATYEQLESSDIFDLEQGIGE